MAYHNEYVRGPKEVAKAAQRNVAREQEVQAVRAKPIVELLKINRSAGVVVLPGSDKTYFMDGLRACVGEDKVAEVKSTGTIQGESTEENEDTALGVLATIVWHRRAHGKNGIIVFKDFNYSDVDSRGNPLVVERVKHLIQSPAANDPSILLVGEGSKADVIGNSDPDLNHIHKHPIGGLILPRLGLTTIGQLSATGEAADAMNHTPGFVKRMGFPGSRS